MTRRVPPGRITPAQTRVLTAIAQGGTQATVAGHLHLAESTVRNILLDARKRVGATTTTHLLALVIAEGDLPRDVADGTAVRR